MKPFRLTLGAMAGWIAVIGFDLAVLTRAYQVGSATGSVVLSLIGFANLTIVVNVLGLQLSRAVDQLRHEPPVEWLNGSLIHAELLALCLLVMLIPILAILFFGVGPT